MPLKHHGQDLYRLDIRYYNYGTLRTGRKVDAYVYLLDKAPTDSQMAALRQLYPQAALRTSRSEYAPELTRPALIFPSAAAIKRAAGVMSK